MFKKTSDLSDEEKREVSKMCRKLMLWILEGRDIEYMSKKLDMQPWQVESNIEEMLYTLKKQIGRKRFLKILFRK